VTEPAQRRPLGPFLSVDAPTADPVFEQLFANRDIAVLERESLGAFRPLGMPPLWFASIWPGARSGRDLVRPHLELTFLEVFLPEAEQFWADNGQGELISIPWSEDTPAAPDARFQASAVCLGLRKLLLVERMGPSYEQQHAAVQRTREYRLTQYRLEQEVNARTHDIRRREEEIVWRLVWAAEYRDEDTGAHIRRIGAYSALLAEAAGWKRPQVEDIRLAAAMHDIGKLGVPDAILRKRGPLTEGERSVMQTHTVVGARILERSDASLLQMAKEIALSHHEWWDGTGYPQRLARGQIPMSARLVAIADVFDALLHRRPYRPAWSEAETVEYIKANVGTQFDPDVFDCFMSVMEPIRQVREEITVEDAPLPSRP